MESLRVEGLDPIQSDLTSVERLFVQVDHLEILGACSQVTASASSFAVAEFGEIHDGKCLDRGQWHAFCRYHLSASLVHKVVG